MKLENTYDQRWFDLSDYKKEDSSSRFSSVDKRVKKCFFVKQDVGRYTLIITSRNI